MRKENTIMKIEHTAVYVKNLKQARDFFLKYFEGHAGEKYVNTKNGFMSYFISFSEGSRLELMSQTDRNEFIQRDCLGYAHIAISVGKKEKVITLTEQLRDDGFEVVSEPRITGDGYFESCIMDREGNFIEITV